QAVAPRLSASPLDDSGINTITHSLAQNTGLRITIMAPDGKVIGESDKPAEAIGQIENHLQRPEGQESLRTGVGIAKRHSATVDVDLLYVAIPVKSQERLLGFVRVSLPLSQVSQTTAHVQRVIGIATMGVGLLTLPFLFVLARRRMQPIQRMS